MHKLYNQGVKYRNNGCPRIIIPDFIFTDCTVGIFDGYDRGCCGIGDPKPKWVWEMGVFDNQGHYFYLDIDTRESKISTKITFILDGVAYYHPIKRFYTVVEWMLNPENGNGTKEQTKLDPKNFIQH